MQKISQMKLAQPTAMRQLAKNLELKQFLSSVHIMEQN